jgi:hypothetical protein
LRIVKWGLIYTTSPSTKIRWTPITDSQKRCFLSTAIEKGKETLTISVLWLVEPSLFGQCSVIWDGWIVIKLGYMYHNPDTIILYTGINWPIYTILEVSAHLLFWSVNWLYPWYSAHEKQQIWKITMWKTLPFESTSKSFTLLFPWYLCPCNTHMQLEIVVFTDRSYNCTPPNHNIGDTKFWLQLGKSLSRADQDWVSIIYGRYPYFGHRTLFTGWNNHIWKCARSANG